MKLDWTFDYKNYPYKEENSKELLGHIKSIMTVLATVKKGEKLTTLQYFELKELAHLIDRINED